MSDRSRSGSRGRRDSRSPRRDRSGSYDRRSDSRGGRREPSPAGSAVDNIDLTDADAAFILGKMGKTKEKIARVSGAKLDLNRLNLEISGPREARDKAKKYVKCVMSQRVGPVYIDEDEKEDLTIVQVPQDCVGFVTGGNGSFLRQVEEEFTTIMFFAEFRGKDHRKGEVEKLAIFGTERARKGAELKVKAAVESKEPGYFTKDEREHESDDEEFGVNTVQLKQDEVSWALGKKGSTKRKVARSSGAIVEYVSNWVYIAGTRAERTRATEYLDWIMQQLKGPIDIKTKGRDDVTVMEIPHDCVGYVTGMKRATLARIEDEWGVFMMFMDRKEDHKEEGSLAKLSIFGLKRARRGAELKVMSSVEGKSRGFFTKGVRAEISRDAWGTDTYLFRDQELSYALGKEGATKRKLARASGCIIEYVGDFAFFSGNRQERLRGRHYLAWLLKQRFGTVDMRDIPMDDHREDVIALDISRDVARYVMGNRGSGLRTIEEETGSFLFMARSSNGDEKLLICCHEAHGRRRAQQLVQQEMRYSGDRGGDRDRYDRDRYSDRRSRSRSRDRYDDRRSRYSDDRGRDRYDDRDRRRGRSYDSYDSRDDRRRGGRGRNDSPPRKRR